jgi:hypothetical protein
LDVLLKFFDVVVDTDAPIADQFLEFHEVVSRIQSVWVKRSVWVRVSGRSIVICMVIFL